MGQRRSLTTPEDPRGCERCKNGRRLLFPPCIRYRRLVRTSFRTAFAHPADNPSLDPVYVSEVAKKAMVMTLPVLLHTLFSYSPLFCRTPISTTSTLTTLVRPSDALTL